MTDELQLLEGAYRDFNARRLDAVLSRMCPDVVWPNGMEGGFVYGHEGVRDYWNRQWEILDPHVEPMSIKPEDRRRLGRESSPGGLMIANVAGHRAERIAHERDRSPA